MPATLCLTVKVFLKQKILDKVVPNRGNKRKPKNQKDENTSKIEVGAVCLLAKLALSKIGLSKNSTAPTNRVMNLHTSSRHGILLLAKK